MVDELRGVLAKDSLSVLGFGKVRFLLNIVRSSTGYLPWLAGSAILASQT